MMIGMARRSSSATTAPAPLTSRTNEQGSVPTKKWRKVSGISGIPRNPFRRLSSSKSRNPPPTPTSSSSTGGTTASEQEASDGQRPQQIVVDDESDVQYIDLDHVVMASPGAGEEAKRTTDLLEEPERRTDHNCRRPDDEDNEGSLVRSDDDPVALLSEGDETRHFPTKQLEGPTLERRTDSGVCPSSPPRRSSRDDDDDDDASSHEPSSPPLTPIPVVYHLPDSLRKRRRRTPLTSPLRDERSPSPPMMESPEGIEWARVQALDSKEEQLGAYWKLLYPDQPPTAAHLTSLDVGTTLKSCLKRARRAADDGRTPGAPKRLQWGSNSAVEFTGQMPPLDFSFLSPDTVDLQFPSSLDRYQERHPVDEVLTQITKDNSAILAVWEGLDDDSSSESSTDSILDNHCFEDDDDDEDENYRPPPPRRLSSAQKTRRRESGIFTPVHRLDEVSDEPIPAPSPVDLSPFEKLTLTSPCKGTSPKSCDEPKDNVTEPSTSLSSSVLFALPTEAEGNDSASSAPVLVETTGFNSVAPRSDSSWRQKLVQILSPRSSPGGPSDLELTHRDCKDSQGSDESTTLRAVEGMDWLEPFDSSSPLRMLVDRSFVLARGALSLLPPSSNHVACFDDDIEALAHADWIEIEIKVLETMVFQLATGQMRDLSIKIGEQAERILRSGSSAWICAHIIREGQELALKEIEVRTLECKHERLKLQCEQEERLAMEWGRDNTRLLQALSSFTLVDTDGADSYLSFPTPVHGLGIAAIHKMDESLMVETQKTHGPSRTSSGIDERVDPTHPCSQLYVPLLDACLRSMNQISTDGGMGSLLTLELLLGRLELALWDVQLFCAEVRDVTVESLAHDGAAIVVVSAPTATNAILRFVYDCSDARTVYSCRPTLAQLVVANVSNAISQSYPQEPLSRVATLLLEELEAQYPC